MDFYQNNCDTFYRRSLQLLSGAKLSLVVLGRCCQLASPVRNGASVEELPPGRWPVVSESQPCTTTRFFPRFRVISAELYVAGPVLPCHSWNSVLQVDFSSIASQAGATLTNLMSHAQELVLRLRALQFDHREFVCLKFLVLFSLGEQRFFFPLIVHSTKHYFQMPNAGCLDVTDIMHFLLGNEIFRLHHASMCVLTRVLAL